MGKACVRFQSADDLALDAVAEVVAALPVEKYVALAKAVQRRKSQPAPTSADRAARPASR
jgi:hypothetical protein